MKEVSNLYPNLSAKNLTIPLQTVSLQSCNESINIEIQNAADTVEKAPNPLHNICGGHGTEDLNEVIAKPI